MSAKMRAFSKCLTGAMRPYARRGCRRNERGGITLRAERTPGTPVFRRQHPIGREVLVLHPLARPDRPDRDERRPDASSATRAYFESLCMAGLPEQ